MFKRSFIIPIRHLLKQKGSSLTNIIGLSIGMTVFIILYLYIRFELSFDKFHKDYQNIFRVVQQQKGNTYQGSDFFVVTPIPLKNALLNDYPEVSEVTQIVNARESLLSYEKEFFTSSGLLTDASFFKVFSFLMLEGDPDGLDEPNTIILSKNLALRMFGEVSPIGKVIRFNNLWDLRVIGIHEDTPGNSHLQFEFLVSFNSQESDPNFMNNSSNWGNSSWYTYMLLNPGNDWKQLETKFPDMVEKYIFSQSEAHSHNWGRRFIIQPLATIHLHSHHNFELSDNNDIRKVEMLGLMAILILLVACINYVNLATAWSFKRYREIGLRKVLGALKLNIRRQFLAESFILTFSSFIIALFLVLFLLSRVSQYFERPLKPDLFQDPMLWMVILGVLVFVGFSAGTYPAIFMAKFKPVVALKSMTPGVQGGKWIRSSLVVFQFTVSIILVLCSLFTWRQLDWIMNQDPGYNHENVIGIRHRDLETRELLPILKEQLLNNPSILEVSISSQFPSRMGSQSGLQVEKENGGSTEIPIFLNRVDESFIPLYGLKLVEGQNFRPRRPGDSLTSIIVNQKLVEQMGWSYPIGKRINNTSYMRAEVVGVLKDFHYASFHLSIKPCALVLDERYCSAVSIKVSPDNLAEAMEIINKTWVELFPDFPINLTSNKDILAAGYKDDQKYASAFIIYALLGIGLAILGLIGLSVYMTSLRTREVAIRKVQGAVRWQLVLLLLKDYGIWLLVANVLAIYPTLMIIRPWLQNFAYRIHISPFIFMVVAIFSMGIACLTVGYQVWNTARKDPASTLRHD